MLRLGLMLLLKLWMNLTTTVLSSAYDKKFIYFVHRHFHILIIEEYGIYLDIKLKATITTNKR